MSKGFDSEYYHHWNIGLGTRLLARLCVSKPLWVSDQMANASVKKR